MFPIKFVCIEKTKSPIDQKVKNVALFHKYLQDSFHRSQGCRPAKVHRRVVRLHEEERQGEAPRVGGRCEDSLFEGARSLRPRLVLHQVRFPGPSHLHPVARRSLDRLQDLRRSRQQRFDAQPLGQGFRIDRPQSSPDSEVDQDGRKGPQRRPPSHLSGPQVSRQNRRPGQQEEKK